MSPRADDVPQDAAVDERAVRGVLRVAFTRPGADALNLLTAVHVGGHGGLPLTPSRVFVLDARPARVDELEHEPAFVRALLLLRLERVLDHAHDVWWIVRVDRALRDDLHRLERVEDGEALRFGFVKVEPAAVNLRHLLAR